MFYSQLLAYLIDEFIFKFSSIISQNFFLSSKLTINFVNVGLNNIFCTFGLKWYVKYKSGMHADHCQSISISFRRWWMKFTNQVHGYELHWGWRGLKMEFVIFNYLFVMLLTKNALLDMFGHRGFQTFPIILAPEKSIGSRYSIMT